MNSDLKTIKKYYGEKMMHLCRENFSTILEYPGLLSNIMLSNFAPSRYLYEDVSNGYLDDFIQTIMAKETTVIENYKKQLIDTEKAPKDLLGEAGHSASRHQNEKDIQISNFAENGILINKDYQKRLIDTGKSPKDLLYEAGYDFFECQSEEDIQKFKKYYQKDEELCTFNGGRLNRCYVFFAISKNINSIKRKDYPNPRRDDEYGTSIMSIQFTRTTPNILSIKNRYNHTVNNPDATYSNNLEKIIPGLTKSFEKYYNLVQFNTPEEFNVPTYVKASDNRFYKYNYERNNIYYCPDNIIIDNFKLQKLAKERYILMENYILDLKEKTIKNYDETSNDSFPNTIENIKNILVTTNKENHTKKIEIITEKSEKSIMIELNKYNEIISYNNPLITKIDDDFLENNTKLKKISLENVREIGNDFLSSNKELTSLVLPKLQKVKDNFLFENKKLKIISMDSLEEVGDNFCVLNQEVNEISFPNLRKVHNNFFKKNIQINKVSLSKVEEIKNSFLEENENLEELELPNVLKVEDDFLLYNEKLKKIVLNSLEEVGRNFLRTNEILETITVPKLKNIGQCFLFNNKHLEELSLESTVNIANNFLYYNTNLKTLYTPKLENKGKFFMRSHPKYKKFNKKSSLLKEKKSFLLRLKAAVYNKNNSKRNIK